MSTATPDRVGSRVGPSRRATLTLRTIALVYLGVLVAVPILLILFRTFEDGIGAFVESITTPAAISALQLSLIIVAIVVRGLRDLVFALTLVLVLVGAVIAPLPALLVEARPALTQDPEIMVRELEVIFALDAVSSELRVASHVLVFLEQLRRVSTLAVVLPVVAPDILASLASTAATAAALSIVDQMPTSLSNRSVPPFFFGPAAAPGAAPPLSFGLALSA